MTGFFRFLEKSGLWAVGLLFAGVGILVAVRLPSSSNKVVGAYLAYLLMHTACMLIVGFSLQKAKRGLAISWLVALILFFVVAVLFGR